jgi:hypothetical protein
VSAVFSISKNKSAMKSSAHHGVVDPSCGILSGLVLSTQVLYLGPPVAKLTIFGKFMVLNWFGSGKSQNQNQNFGLDWSGSGLSLGSELNHGSTNTDVQMCRCVH